MSTLTKDIREIFLGQFLVPKDPLYHYRKSAFDKVLELNLPTQKNEAFQYLKMRSLYHQSLRRAHLEQPSEKLKEKLKRKDSNRSCLFICNGSFISDFSSDMADDFICMPFSKAIYDYGAFFKNYLDKFIETERDPFTLLSFAMGTEGLFLFFPRDVKLEKEIEIVEINDLEESLISPVVLGCLGKNASVTLVSSTQSIGKSNFINSSFHFCLEENAHLTFFDHAVDNSGWKFHSQRALLKKDAFFQAHHIDISPKISRYSAHVKLLESNASVNLLGLWALKDKEESHTNVLIEHLAPHCQSSQLFKGMNHHQSISSFEGKIYVDKIAQQTNAYQLNNNFLLGDKAISYSKPNLEIFADDVKASHGSTTGKLDLEMLFYLRSRGLKLKVAQELLLTAFCSEVLEEIKSSCMKKDIQSQLQDYFKIL